MNRPLASRLAKFSSKAATSSQQIKTAVRLILPAAFATHPVSAVTTAAKAVTKYTFSEY